MSAIGMAVDRVDGVAKVTGRATYAAEAAPDGLVYAALVESTIPAGSILAIDDAQARSVAGVLHVLTYLNAPTLPYDAPAERPAVEPVSGQALRVLQDATIRFSGQPIGVVIATTQARAEYAASLVRVRYDRHPGPALRFDPDRGRPTSEAAARRGRGPETSEGDADVALAAAEVVVRGRYRLQREHHNAMEPHATVARWDDGRLTLWDKSQWVGNVRDEMALVFGIAPESVRVISPFVGGAFGSALRTWPHVTLAALAAHEVGRPVRLELTRRQLYTSVGFRPATQQDVALGADRDGHLQAIVQDATGQTSTYEEFAEATLDVPAVTYACANRRTRYRLVAMNTNTPCPMRGPGHTTGLLAQEIAMDELAAALNMDPIALRLRNFAERDPRRDLPWSSNALRECYRVGAERFGWDRRDLRPKVRRDGRDLVGFGMATALNPSPRYPATASATLFADGSAVLRSATSDMGPGTTTAMTQVAADALGLPVARVRFELGDSALPEAKEHGGSTTTASVGSAVLAACEAVLAKLRDLRGANGRGVADVENVLQRAGLARLDAAGRAAPGEEKQRFSAYSFGAVFAEVRVDLDFGTVRAT